MPTNGPMPPEGRMVVATLLALFFGGFAAGSHLRRHYSKGRAPTNYGHFLVTASAGTVFSIITLYCVWAFLRAWYDKRHPSTVPD